MNSQWKRMMVRSAAVLLCSTGLVVATAMAQDTSAPPPPPPGQQGPPPEGGYGGRGGMHPERQVEMMQKRLGLSDDQTAQVKGVFETERGKMEALRSNSSLSRPEMRSQMMAIHQDEEVKLHTILTPDQAKKYDEMQARQREHMQERREGGQGDGAPPPPPPPAL